MAVVWRTECRLARSEQEDPWGCRRPRRGGGGSAVEAKARAPPAPCGGRAVDLLRVGRGLEAQRGSGWRPRSPHPDPCLSSFGLWRPSLSSHRSASSLHPHSDSAGFRSCLASPGLQGPAGRVQCRWIPVGPGFSQAVPIPVFVIEILGLQEHQGRVSRRLPVTQAALQGRGCASRQQRWCFFPSLCSLGTQ